MFSLRLITDAFAVSVVDMILLIHTVWYVFRVVQAGRSGIPVVRCAPAVDAGRVVALT
jgi:hypothetical protein